MISTQRRGDTKTQSKKEARRARYAAINATWKKMRPDLHHSAEELREARLEFAAQVLGIPPIGSLGDLTIPQLDRVIEAMKKSYQQPSLGVGIIAGSKAGLRLVGSDVKSTACGVISPNPQFPTPAEVIHLASDEQVWAIEQVLSYLQTVWGWSKEGCSGFLRKNYRRESAHMLSPRQAGGAMTILLTIAAKKEITRRLGNDVKVSRAMIRCEMPSLKQRIGIDRAAKVARQGK